MILKIEAIIETLFNITATSITLEKNIYQKKPLSAMLECQKENSKGGNLYTWGCTSTALYKQMDKSFIGRTDVEAETPILWPPDVKS